MSSGKDAVHEDPGGIGSESSDEASENTTATMPPPNIQSLAAALNAFASAPRNLQILHTTPSYLRKLPTKTLYILDSSFNPPTVAHLEICASALQRHVQLQQRWKDSQRRRREKQRRFEEQGQMAKPDQARASEARRSGELVMKIETEKEVEEFEGDDPGPPRLLLLLSTKNADKAPAPAAFPHRLSMMCMLADAIWENHAKSDWRTRSLFKKDIDTPHRFKTQIDRLNDADNNDRVEGDELGGNELIIDVGVIKSPLFVDKVSTLERSGAYDFDPSYSMSAPFEPFTPSPLHRYPEDHEAAKRSVRPPPSSPLLRPRIPPPHQIHLMGFDTLVRVMDPKYYEDGTLNALGPLYGGYHSIQVARRWPKAEDRPSPNSDSDSPSPVSSSTPTSDSTSPPPSPVPDTSSTATTSILPEELHPSKDAIASQRHIEDSFLSRLSSGAMEPIGGKRSWASHLQFMEDIGEAAGVSSTLVREMVGRRRNKWPQLVHHTICNYIKRLKLYREDAEEEVAAPLEYLPKGERAPTEKDIGKGKKKRRKEERKTKEMEKKRKETEKEMEEDMGVEVG